MNKASETTEGRLKNILSDGLLTLDSPMFKLAVGMTVGELSAYSPETKQLFDGLLAYINRNDTIKRSIFSSFFQESREVK